MLSLQEPFDKNLVRRKLGQPLVIGGQDIVPYLLYRGGAWSERVGQQGTHGPFVATGYSRLDSQEFV